MSGSKCKSSGVLLYFSRYCTVRLKMFSLHFVSLCYVFISVKNVVDLYSIVLYSQMC